MSRREVGSDFHWSAAFLTGVPETALPKDAELFATGRGALVTLLTVGRDTRPCLHLPSHFCMEVASALSVSCEIRWYRDLPNERQPDFDTLRPEPGDFVLANNPFGLREAASWLQWRKPAEVCLIEDHTHDIAGAWATGSTADYAIASLRKTLPLPDGGLLW